MLLLLASFVMIKSQAQGAKKRQRGAQKPTEFLDRRSFVWQRNCEKEGKNTEERSGGGDGGGWLVNEERRRRKKGSEIFQGFIFLFFLTLLSCSLFTCGGCFLVMVMVVLLDNGGQKEREQGDCSKYKPWPFGEIFFSDIIESLFSKGILLSQFDPAKTYENKNNITKTKPCTSSSHHLSSITLLIYINVKAMGSMMMKNYSMTFWFRRRLMNEHFTSYLIHPSSAIPLVGKLGKHWKLFP